MRPLCSSLLLTCSLSFSWLTGATAQTLKVGAVLPLSGTSANTGRVAAAALQASVQNLLSAGIELELTILDGRGRPDEAATQTRTLVAAGIHALLCCETEAEAEAVSKVTEAAGVPTLLLSPTAPGDAAFWSFMLLSGDAEALERLALEPVQSGPAAPIVLLAPTGAAGDRANAALEPTSVGVVRYPAGRTPLTPEALQAATLEPGSVVIWDEAAGTLRAATALSARGFEGLRIVRAGVWDELGALERAELTGAVSVVSPAVLGYTLADAHPSKQATSSFRRALSDLPTLYLTGEAGTIGAGAWDAAVLLGAAAEQVLTYAPPDAPTDEPDDPGVLRGALRDALVGLGPVIGAGGSYDFSDRRTGPRTGLLADSLVLAVWRGGRFWPLP